jgi:hypothetical protein
MIENVKQYEITKNWLAKFQQSVNQLIKDGPAQNVHPGIHQAQIDAQNSQIEIFKDDIAEYEQRMGITHPIISDNVSSYEDDPFFKEKAKKAKDFLDRTGLPDQTK